MDVEVIKFDSAKNIAWVGIYSVPSTEYGLAVTESQDGGYFLTGQSHYYGDNTKKSCYALKINSAG